MFQTQLNKKIITQDETLQIRWKIVVKKTHEVPVASLTSYVHLNHAHSYLNQEVSDTDGFCVCFI